MKKNYLGGLLLILTSLCFNLQAQQPMDAEESSQTEDQLVQENAAAEEVQEVKYVTDKLRLSLYKTADSNSGILKLLVSGDKLDVMERSGPYSRVRTQAGLSGWVKNGFLVSTPTASFQLLEEQNKNRILAEQIEKYADSKQLIEDYEKTIAQLNSDNDELASERQQAEQQLETLRGENSVLSDKIAARDQQAISIDDSLTLLKQFWYFAAAAVLIFFLVGFVLGRELVEAKVRRRFQGVKVW